MADNISGLFAGGYTSVLVAIIRVRRQPEDKTEPTTEPTRKKQMKHEKMDYVEFAARDLEATKTFLIRYFTGSSPIMVSRTQRSTFRG